MMSEIKPLCILNEESPGSWLRPNLRSTRPKSNVLVVVSALLFLCVIAIASVTQRPNLLMTQPGTSNTIVAQLRNEIKMFEAKMQSVQADQAQKINDLKAQADEERQRIEERLAATKERSVNRDRDSDSQSVMDKLKNALGASEDKKSMNAIGSEKGSDLKADADKERQALEEQLTATKERYGSHVNQVRADAEKEIQSLQEKIKNANADMERAAGNAARSVEEGVHEAADAAREGANKVDAEGHKAAGGARNAVQKAAEKVKNAAGHIFKGSNENDDEGDDEHNTKGSGIGRY